MCWYVYECGFNLLENLREIFLFLKGRQDIEREEAVILGKWDFVALHLIPIIKENFQKDIKMMKLICLLDLCVIYFSSSDIGLLVETNSF